MLLKRERQGESTTHNAKPNLPASVAHAAASLLPGAHFFGRRLISCGPGSGSTSASLDDMRIAAPAAGELPDGGGKHKPAGECVPSRRFIILLRTTEARTLCCVLDITRRFRRLFRLPVIAV
jgi:hypothetical protein